MSVTKKWMKKGKLCYGLLYDINGVNKTMMRIESVHKNTIVFEGGRTWDENHVEQIKQLIPVNDLTPEGENLFLGYQDEVIIGYYNELENEAENNNELLENITHFMPIPELETVIDFVE